MLTIGTPVKIVRGLDIGCRGKVEGGYYRVKGVVLSQPIYLVRLDEPNEIGSILTTAVEDELEIIDRIESVGPFHCRVISHHVPKKLRVIALGPAPEAVEIVEGEWEWGKDVH